MNRKFKLCLASPPGAPNVPNCTPSVMAYRIGQDCHLYRVARSFDPIGLMDIDCTSFTGAGDLHNLAAEISDECARGYSGVVMDMAGEISGAKKAILNEVSETLRQRGLSLFVPLRYAGFCEAAALLVPCFCVAGSLGKRLRDVIAAHRGRKLFLVIDCAPAEFSLPYSGGGRPVASSELEQLSARFPRRYSTDLAANCITYTSAGRRKIILWDDKKSVGEKLRLGSELGYTGAFLYRPQVEGFIKSLIAEI